MKDMPRPMTDERTFIESIDCAFPYADERRALDLIRTAAALSAEAAFKVVHELACPPASCRASSVVRSRLLDALDASFSHPAKAVVFPIARRMIAGEVLDVTESIAALERVAATGRVWEALHLIYFSCDDRDGAMDAAIGRIEAARRQGGGTDAPGTLDGRDG